MSSASKKKIHGLLVDRHPRLRAAEGPRFVWVMKRRRGSAMPRTPSAVAREEPSSTTTISAALATASATYRTWL